MLRAELARGDRVMEASSGILHHLLSHDGQSSFSDEILARVNGMIGHLADQLLLALAMHLQGTDPDEFALARREPLISLLIDNHACLLHLHGLALEWQLAQRMQQRTADDPDLSPLLQALISSEDETMASSAMALLASQARFTLQARRMELPLAELPGDLFHMALLSLRNCTQSPEEEAAAVAAEKQWRAEFDESRGRLALASRLVTAMGGGAMAALSISHAGAPLFLSALAMASGQSRLSATLATTEQQKVRLALSLRAAGLKPDMVKHQLALIQPEVVMPEGVLHLGVEHAMTLLAETSQIGMR